jgi:tRNA dimethylallyltransferase
MSGKTLTEWQREARQPPCDIAYLKVGLQIEPRGVLHERIALRLKRMLEDGFVDELRGLRERPGLTEQSPSMRSVGYRQFWQFLDGHLTLEQASDKALFATRQLAKRQFTWLRSEKSVFTINPLEAGAIDAISAHLKQRLDAQAGVLGVLP